GQTPYRPRPRGGALPLAERPPGGYSRLQRGRRLGPPGIIRARHLRRGQPAARPSANPVGGKESLEPEIRRLVIPLASPIMAGTPAGEGVMRTSTAAMALIRRESAGGPEWLTQWNEGWQSFHLVGGHRAEGESFRECCARELSEELGLCAGADVRLGDAPAAHLEHVAFSRSAGVETAYTVELFDAELITEHARRNAAAPGNRCVAGY